MINKKKLKKANEIVEKYNHKLTFMREDPMDSTSAVKIGHRQCVKCNKVFFIQDKKLEEPCYG